MNLLSLTRHSQLAHFGNPRGMNLLSLTRHSQLAHFGNPLDS